jgi:hypothetical protein
VILPKQGEPTQTGIVLQYLACRESIVALCRLPCGAVKSYLPVRIKVYQTDEEAREEAHAINIENDNI